MTKRAAATISAVFLCFLTAGCVTPTNTAAPNFTWKASCGSDYSNPSDGTYIFNVKLGEVGGCESDKVKQDWGYGNKWDWSERAEVKTRSDDMFGKWEWSAIIDIDRNCIPALRNTLFQVHAGGYLVSPPSWLGINRFRKFRTNKGRRDTAGRVPDSPFKLTVKINATKKEVDVDYFVNDEFLISTHNKAKRTYDNLFLKFGVYRVNANCDITQTYTNVKLRKIN